MKYKEHEVLDILKLVSDNPEQVLSSWNNRKANKPIDLDKFNYPYFVYSFPIIIDDEEVATITLVSLYGGNLNSEKPDLMQKYFGHEDYEKSWHAFSHDTYLDCYLTIHKDFGLPKVVKGLRGQSFTAKDANGNDFEFKVSYGFPEKERDKDQYFIWVEGAYRFDNGVAIQIENKFEGWSLGKKINENIKIRVRDQKIEEII